MLNTSTFRVILLFLFLSLKLSATSTDSIYLYHISSQNMDARSSAIAVKCIHAIEKNQPCIFQPFFQSKINFNEKLVSHFSVSVSGTKKIIRYFHSPEKQYSLTKVYSKFYQGKRKYLFQVEVIMSKKNPYLIEAVKISRRVKLPRFVSESMRKIDDKNVSQEEKRHLIAAQIPFVPSYFMHIIEVDWKANKVYLNNSLEYSKYKWDAYESLQPKYLNETSIPIKYKVISIDSVRLPPILFELKNMEKLRIAGKNITEIPAQVGQLRNLEFLSITLYTNSVVEIPSAIKQLKKLRKLNIYAQNSVKIPWKQSDTSQLEIIVKEKLGLYDFNLEYSF